jgi:hypothetical protein
MKRIIVIPIFVFTFLNATDTKKEKLNLPNIKTDYVKVIPNDVYLKDEKYIKTHQKQIREILKKFDELIEETKGFEEQYLIINLKHLFMKRYYLEEGDEIMIDRKLNGLLDKNLKNKLKTIESN